MKTFCLSKNCKKLVFKDDFRCQIQLQWHLPSLHCLQKLSIVAHNVTFISALTFWGLEYIVDFNLELPKLQNLPDVTFWQQKNLRRLVLILPRVNVFGTKLFTNNTKLTILKIWSRSILIYCEMFEKLVHLEQFFLRTSNNRTVYLSMLNCHVFRLPKLKKLYLQAYHSLYFDVFYSVRYLNIPNSELFSNDFISKFINLTYLNLTNNFLNLTSININKKSHLKILILRNNQIRSLDVAFFHNLQHIRFIDFYSCQMLAIDSTINLKTLCPFLQYLSFRSNYLSDFQFTRNLFANCNSLQKLDLSHNNLMVISNWRTIKHQQIFDGLINLKILLLNGNNLTKVPSKCFRNLFSLTVLDLSSNRIQSLNSDWFNSKSQLKVLYLQNNEICEISRKFLKCLPRLKVLDLSSNNLTKLFKKNFENNSNLRKLNLGDNRIRSVYRKHFVHLSQLRFLDLQNNHITAIKSNTIFDLTYLRMLNLKDNQLEYSTIKNLMLNRYLEIFINDFDNDPFL